MSEGIDAYIKKKFEVPDVDIRTYSPLTLAYIFDGDAPCKKLVADCICTGKIFRFLCPGTLRNLFIDELFQFCIHARSREGVVWERNA